MITLDVNTQNKYPIKISDGFESLFSGISQNRICIVSDEKVASLYLDKVRKNLEGKRIFSYLISGGEKCKNAENYFDLLCFLADNGFTRGDAVIALGGGVVGDLSGFVSATYMRGIAYYQIPTTFLAMIDSSVGGKTGINLPQGKNLVGAFYQPSGVFINVNTLATLDSEQMQNGMGEYAKYAFLSSSVCKDRVNTDIKTAVYDCLKVKTAIVEEDEKEAGKRSLLNLGHTVGHALEMLSGYTLLHGTCVAKGIYASLKISKKYYGMSDEKFTELESFLRSFGFDLTIPYEKEDILRSIRIDKKAYGGYINFVMIYDIGDCRIEKITFDELKGLL